MIPLQMTNGGPGKFLQEEVWQVSATKARRTPEETQMEMKLFAFPSVCLTDPPPSFYGVHYKGVRPYQKFDGSHTYINKKNTHVLPLKFS